MSYGGKGGEIRISNSNNIVINTHQWYSRRGREWCVHSPKHAYNIYFWENWKSFQTCMHRKNERKKKRKKRECKTSSTSGFQRVCQSILTCHSSQGSSSVIQRPFHIKRVSQCTYPVALGSLHDVEEKAAKSAQDHGSHRHGYTDTINLCHCIPTRLACRSLVKKRA